MLIRGGTVIDGTGAPQRIADVAIINDRVVDVAPNIVGTATRVIDATDRVVTPGFVDIHTHLDAQLAWDPIGSSSCYHGITSVVMGNCGVTFAPCRPEDREVLAAMMESVEDIPRDAILDGLAWDWVTYGEYLRSMSRLPKGLNVGGMVGHCALRQYAMGSRGIEEAPPTAEDMAIMTCLLGEAMRGGALGFSTSRTFLHKVPDGRPVPGTYAEPEELFLFADVLGRHGAGVFESASRIGEGDRDNADIPGTRAELAWMGEVSRRSGRPVSFGLLQHDSRPDLYAQVIELAKHENSLGANVRPQTTARSVGVLFSLDTRSPFDRADCWRDLRTMRNGKKLVALRDPVMRARLIEAADATPSGLDLNQLFVVNHPDGRRGGARYDLHRRRRSPPLPTNAASARPRPTSNCSSRAMATWCAASRSSTRSLSAVEHMLDEQLVTLGLADAGAHVGQILDASQPTFLLSYWIRERQRWSLEEGVRRLTSDTADLFGLADRGRLVSGAFADVNVIDFDALDMPPPSYVYDFPHGAGRYVQRCKRL